MDVINLKKLAQFSHEKGLLNAMEKRRHVKKNLLKTRCFNLALVCLNRGQEIPLRPEPYEYAFALWKVQEHLQWTTRKLTCCFRRIRTPLGGLYKWRMR
jgi:hypothetical protein